MADIPQNAYHSQLRPPVAASPTGRFSLGDSVAFQHRLTPTLPAEYADCDVLYSELPWQNGMEVFNRRAGVEVAYRDFLNCVSAVVSTSFVPVILVTGKHAVRRLPAPTQLLNTTLNNDPAVALLYNLTTDPIVSSATELIGDLAEHYDRVGDFCCGYGRTLRIFHQAGRTFVGSDYNANCIGYIAEHATGW